MANIRAKYDKNGNLFSYQIRVFRGRDTDGKQLKPYFMTWIVPQDKSEKWIKKELEKQATLFEEKCKSGNVCSSKQKFQDYAAYAIEQKERAGAKARTITSYREKLPRINASFGYLHLADIKPQHINAFYAELAAEGSRENASTAVLKIDFKKYLKEHKITQNDICEAVKMSDSTLRRVIHKETVSLETAQRICDFLGEDIKKLFNISNDNRPLSDNTILDYHRTISMIFGFAIKEQLLTVNPAKLATPPKEEEKEVNYFQPEELASIVEALEKEPLKWRVLIHLLLVTGARRAEILGLKWSAIDFEAQTLYINNTVLYTKEKGVYQDTPKTKKSKRKIKVTAETIKLLKEYKVFYDTNKANFGNNWHDTELLFYQTNKIENIGLPINPSSINRRLTKFAEKASAGHINPHAFRHPYVKYTTKIFLKNRKFLSTLKRRAGKVFNLNPVVGKHINPFNHQFNK